MSLAGLVNASRRRSEVDMADARALMGEGGGGTRADADDDDDEATAAADDDEDEAEGKRRSRSVPIEELVDVADGRPLGETALYSKGP